MNADGTERQRIAADQIPALTWNEHSVNPRFTVLHPQADGSYIYLKAQEEGIYILRLRLTP